MLERADGCEKLADLTRDNVVAHSLREAARQWRAMAVQQDLLKREPTYRRSVTALIRATSKDCCAEFAEITCLSSPAKAVP